MKYDRIQDYINEVMRQFKEKEAVSYQGKKYTYQNLDNDSNKIVGYLQNRGFQAGDFVGVISENRYEILISFLAIIKVHGVFVPLDTEFPKNRLLDMLVLANASFLLADSSNAATMLCSSIQDVEIGMIKDIVLEGGNEKDDIFFETYSNSEQEINAQKQEGLYLYFTSGTTGKPKPILGSNKGLTHFINWEIEQFQITCKDRISQLTPPCHDPFLRDVLVPLCCGATLCIPDSKEMILQTDQLTKWIEKEKISFIHCTPSLFSVFNDKKLDKNMFLSLRYILLAGERVFPNSLMKWFEAFHDRIQLVNVYGPTETTLAKFFYEIKEKDLNRNSIPIGQPIKGAQAILLDDNKKMVGTGMVGEIYIRTPYRTLGYYNDGELTAKKFIVNPFTKKETDLLYKTGDLARILTDGNFEFIGRADRQVKIRGFRVELSEIENELIKLDGISDAAVLYDSKEGNGQIHAFVVKEEQDEEITLPMVQEYLSSNLPDYMLPHHLKYLDSIPMTGNHKKDYQKLLSIPTEDKQVVCQPKTKTEKLMLAIWNELLGNQTYGMEDSFFRAGGNSIMAMRLINEIAEKFEVAMPLEVIFENGSIQGLSSYIDENTEMISEDITVVEPAEFYEITQAQKRMFVVCSMMGNHTVYNLPNVILVEGIFDKNIFEQAMNQLVERHSSFRTGFFMKEEHIYQRILPSIKLDIPYIEIQESEVVSYINAFIRPFDLLNAPLIRAQILRISEDKHYLLFDMHHIIADGTSLSIFTNELLQLCIGKELSAPRIQYVDYTYWQRERTHTDEMQDKKAFWVNLYKENIPVMNFPTDYPRPSVKTYNGDRIRKHLDGSQVTKVKELAVQYGVTPYTIFYTAYLILLHKFTGQSEFIVGTPVQGRNHAAVQQMIGMFVNTLPLRNKVESHDTVDSLIKQVGNAVIQMLEHQEYPLDELIEGLDLPRDTSRNPLFDTVFAYHNYEFPELTMGGMHFSEYPYHHVCAKFDFEFAVIEKHSQIDLQLEYCTDLFKQSTMDTFLRYYLKVLSELHDTRQMIQDMNLIENQRILLSGYETIDYAKDLTISAIFQNIAKQYPKHIAIKFENEKMTYEELNKYANRLANALIGKGIKPNDLVPLFAKRSVQMIVGILGIVKAGGAYVPINPDYPTERIDYMLEQIRPKIIVRSSQDIDVHTNVEVISLDNEDTYGIDDINPRNRNTQEDTLYVIFTSGTTGNPKGVMVSHRNLVRLFFNANPLYDFNEKDTWLLFHSFCFDFSVWEIFGALLFGGKLIVVPQEKLIDTYMVNQIVHREGITVFNQVPSAFYNFINLSYEKCESLRYLIFGGEKLVPSKLKQWYQNNTHVKVINMYGITETCIHVTYKEITQIDMESDTSNIGKAIPTLGVLLFNGNNLCAPGIPGEICVTGAGLAKGYLNNETLTRSKFTANPLDSEMLMYRSGDLGSWLENGEIEYLGRIDEQVQLRGFRIELGEIESKMRKFEGIINAVAQVKESTKDTYLVAYYIAKYEIDSRKLRDFLISQLPDYMVPQFFVSLDEIPLTVNGKVNKAILPDPKDLLNEVAASEEACSKDEQILTDIWEKILQVKVSSVSDNFFLLGGDSIKALQVVSELKKQNLSIAVEDIFKYQTVKELSPQIRTNTRLAEQGLVTGDMVLTPIQSWFMQRDTPAKNHWNQAVMLHTKEEIDEFDVEGALQSVVLHHDVLRSVFRLEKEEIKAYNRGVEGELYLVEVCELTNVAENEQLVTAKTNEYQESFSLEEGPLVKALLFKEKESTRIFLVVHHMVIDSISWRIVLEDFIHALTMLKNGENVVLPMKTDSFLLWGNRLQEYLNYYSVMEEITYWKQLKSKPHTNLKRNSIKAEYDCMKNTVIERIQFSVEETQNLRMSSNQAYHTETQDLLLAGLGIALSEWQESDQDSQYFVNLEGHGREEILENIDITRTVGWFTSFYPVLLEISKDNDLKMTLKTIKEMMRKIPNNGVGYGILNYLDTSLVQNSFNINPEISFSYFGNMGNPILNDDFEIVDYSYGKLIGDEVKPPFELDVIAVIEDERLSISIGYNKLKFEKTEIIKLILKLQESIQKIIEHCSLKEEVEFTPDDFGSSDLSLQELESILELSESIR